MPDFNPYEPPQTELAKTSPLIPRLTLYKFLTRLSCGFFSAIFTLYCILSLGMDSSLKPYFATILPLIVLAVSLVIGLVIYSSIISLRLLAWMFSGYAMGWFADALFQQDIRDSIIDPIGGLFAIIAGWMGFIRWPERTLDNQKQ